MPKKRTDDTYYTLYTVKEREGKDNIWTRIGAAFPHKNGFGFNIRLNALPTDGDIVALDQAHYGNSK